MHWIDWLVLVTTLGYIANYGYLKTRNQSSLQEYIVGQNQQSWWKLGIAVMATQASAITFISTTGQGYADGLRFAQFYFGLPLATIVIVSTFIPIYYKLKVFTAYEYLEGRFDVKVRTLTAMLFLVQRGMAAGITIYAPSIILSIVLGWNLQLTHILVGLVVVIYTVSGGVRAVNVTQIQQMMVILVGMLFIFLFLIYKWTLHSDLSEIIPVAQIYHRTKLINTEFNWQDRYNLWSGLTGGFFLMLAYFGTDQSQVQRYLGGKLQKSASMGMIMNAIVKIPMQIFILACGVLVFLSFQFEKQPLHFNPKILSYLKENHQAQSNSWEHELDSVYNLKSKLLLQNSEQVQPLREIYQFETSKRKEIETVAKQNREGIESNEKDYIFLYYILHFLPHGLIGLLIAVILAAAMSSVSAELIALGSTTMVDFYIRFKKKEIKPSQEIFLSRIFTAMWGLIAIVFALFIPLFENLIQFINIIGSLFYGTILGVFLCAFYVKYIQSKAVFIAAILAEILTFGLFTFTNIGFLWFNVISCVFVILTALCLQFFINRLKPNVNQF
ncbi:MAG: sodium:solute symporter [Saprospiraceae bacterium]|jgi:SSS family solute:Na+ symporter|nr:sodium:solute symporter [Saprospiraceae bacterium]